MTRRIVAVVFEGFLLLDLAGPLGAFELAAYHVPGGYAVELVSADGGMVRSSAGVKVDTVRFAADGPVDLLIVPGGPGTEAAAGDGGVRALVRDVHSYAAKSASVCSGALLLAAAGLLAGKRATTHWGVVETLRRDYPQVEVAADVLFIEDGNVWTSAGISAGIDLALALIERDHGFAIAQEAAQALVMQHRRRGGGGQFSTMLELQGPDGRFGPLLDWARERLHEPLGVDRLAGECRLSSRQFSRAFAGATGVSPGKAIEKMRVDHARADVVAGQESLHTVAQRYGFGDAARMRRSFIRVLGKPPRSMR